MIYVFFVICQNDFLVINKLYSHNKYILFTFLIVKLKFIEFLIISYNVLVKYKTLKIMNYFNY